MAFLPPSESTETETFLAYWLGYVETGRTLEQTPSQVDTVALAFGVTAPGNTITTDFLTSKHSEQEIRAGVKWLHSQGKKVVMSISGNPNWPGHPYGWENLDPATFAANAKKIIIDDWGLDGIDLDNEGSYSPSPTASGNFVQVVKAIRREFGPDKTITLPVYMGASRDAYLAQVKNEIDAVYTMAYWDDYDAQIALLRSYQALVGVGKAGIGVAEAANPGQNTPFSIVPRLASYMPKAGMMLWTLNSDEAPKWCAAIGENMPIRRKEPAPA